MLYAVRSVEDADDQAVADTFEFVEQHLFALGMQVVSLDEKGILVEYPGVKAIGILDQTQATVFAETLGQVDRKRSRM